MPTLVGAFMPPRSDVSAALDAPTGNTPVVEALAGIRRYCVCKPQIRRWPDTAQINGAAAF